MCGQPVDPISFEQASKEIWQRLVAHAALNPLEDHSPEAEDQIAALHEEADIRVLGLIIQEELRRWTEDGRHWKCPTRQALEQIIFSHNRGEPWGLFVDRQELAKVAAARWPNDLRGLDAQSASRGTAQRSGGKGGRTPGSGTFAKVDKPFHLEMDRLIESGEALSVHAAAKLVALRAPGTATEASKISRLSKGYKKWKIGA